MVEPLFFANLGSAPGTGQIFTLSGPEAKHAVTVRRMREGEAIQITDGHGVRLRGTVLEPNPNALQILIGDVVQEPKPSPEISLVQALAKGDRDELAIQAATELGVWQVIPWQAERSVSRWEGPKRLKGRERWQQIVTEAAKQSLRCWIPEVTGDVTTKELTQQLSNFDRVWVLEPTAVTALADEDFSKFERVAVVVGPEGGIAGSELTMLESAGAVPVRLGDSVLRTSTAGMAAIAVIQSGSGNWRAK